MPEPEHEWLCPWCRAIANKPGNMSGICESKRCECGALGIATPPWDTDEIVDDSIGVFGIPEGYLTPYDSDRVARLQQVGVEVAEGKRIPAGVLNRFELRVPWSRRREHAT